MRFEHETQRWGLTINVKKTKQLITEVNKSVTKDVDIEIRGEKVERVKDFVYLGSALDERGSCGVKIERRIRLDLWRFNELRKPVWSQSSISVKTKMQIYEATVLSVILYGCETWTCTDKDYKRLNIFHTKRLRAILGKRKDEISNKNLYSRTRSGPLENKIRKARLRWAGHVRRMEDKRIPKRVLFGELVEGKGKGEPRSNWLKCLEEDCMKVNIPYGRWTGETKNRQKWRNTLSYLTVERKKKDTN